MQTSASSINPPKILSNPRVTIWVSILCLIVFLMVVIGGITRLTGSGLSMVDWRPLMGTIPPMSEVAWLEVFLKYQSSPEFKLVNFEMTLSEFKTIFMWEYIHRLIGRLLGVAFFFPWLYFLLKKQLTKQVNRQTLFAFFLGGCQGLLGWYMVKSGLVKIPEVSHYRLASHLLLAFIIFGLLFWTALNSFDSHRLKNKDILPPRFIRLSSTFIVWLILFQVLYGAFTAGTHAGLFYNTFPKMNGEWVPSRLLEMSPIYLNFLENRVSLQFVHRTLAWILLFSIVAFWFVCRAHLTLTRQRWALHCLLLMIVIQFMLGMVTLLLKVPISMASLHQVGAAVLFLLALNLNYVLLHPFKQTQP